MTLNVAQLGCSQYQFVIVIYIGTAQFQVAGCVVGLDGNAVSRRDVGIQRHLVGLDNNLFGRQCL